MGILTRICVRVCVCACVRVCVCVCARARVYVDQTLRRLALELQADNSAISARNDHVW